MVAVCDLARAEVDDRHACPAPGEPVRAQDVRDGERERLRGERGRGRSQHHEDEDERAQRLSHDSTRYRTRPTDHWNVIVTSRRPQLAACASLGTQTSMRSPMIAEPVSAATQLP